MVGAEGQIVNADNLREWAYDAYSAFLLNDVLPHPLMQQKLGDAAEHIKSFFGDVRVVAAHKEALQDLGNDPTEVIDRFLANHQALLQTLSVVHRLDA